MQLALYGPFANSWGGLQPLLVGKARQPQLLYACFLYPDSNFPQLFGMSSLPEVGVLLSRTWACRCVCSGCPSDHKCVQFVFKTSLHHYINIQSCYFMQKFISPAILGMFQTVAIPQSQLRCCAVGAVQPFAKPNQIFRNSCSRCGACISAAFCILVCLSPQRVRWRHWRGAQLLTESRAAA